MAKQIVTPTATRLPQNLVLRSNQFNASPWLKARQATPSQPGTITDPFGGTDAWLMQSDGGSTGACRVYQSVTGDAKSDYTISVYAKMVPGNDITAVWIGTVHTSVDDVVYDIENGVIHDQDSDVDNATITDVGNGWYRLTYTANAANVNSSFSVYIGMHQRNDALPYATTMSPNDGTQQCYFYGAQLERYSTAGQYIESTTIALNGGNRVLTKLPQNLMPNSEDFSTGWQVYNDGALEQNQLANPVDSAVTADVLKDDAGATGPGTVRVLQAFTLPHEGQYTASIYAKKKGLDWFNFNVTDLTGITSIKGFFDLTNGVIGVTLGTDQDAAYITDVGNGWYRCELVFTQEGTDFAGAFDLRVAEDNNDAIVDTDDTSSIYLFGAMVNKGERADPYVATGTTATPGVNTNRASTATYYDHNGVLQTAGYGQERTDYDPSDNSLQGLLLQFAATNLCEYSEDFASWPLLNTPTFNSNSEIAPDGTQTADRVGDNNNTAYEACQGTFTIVDSTVYTYSMYMKKETSVTNYPGIEIYMSTGSVFHLINFDPVNGTAIEKTDAGFTATSGGITIEDHGDYWRIIGTFTGSGTSCRFSLYPAINTSHSTGISTTAQQEVVVWGAQLEGGAQASSYIPNLSTGSTSRSSDYPLLTDLTAIDHNATAGSMFAKVELDDLTAVDRLFAIGTGATRLYDCYVQTGQVKAYGSTTLSMSGAALTVSKNTEFLYAAAWAENDAASVVDGGTIVKDTSYSPLPTPDNLLSIGSLNGTDIMNGHIKELTYYPRRLRDEELVTLSGGGFLSGAKAALGLALSKIGRLGL